MITFLLIAGKLRRLYKTALQLEVAFFDAQHVAATPARIGMLVTDFDDTCTASDTISTIIQTATEAKVRAAEASGEPFFVKSHIQSIHVHVQLGPVGLWLQSFLF